MTLTSNHCTLFRNSRNQTPNKPLSQHDTSNEAATMMDDEYAYWYYDDLAEIKKRTREVREGPNSRKHVLTGMKSCVMIAAPIWPSTTRRTTQSKIELQQAPQRSVRVLVPGSRPLRARRSVSICEVRERGSKRSEFERCRK